MFQILIVEDDKELSQLFQKVLEKNGYQVKSASDGALALEILDKEYIDLIISDIMMSLEKLPPQITETEAGPTRQFAPVPWSAGRAGPDHQRAVPRLQPEKGRLFAAAYRCARQPAGDHR